MTTRQDRDRGAAGEQEQRVQRRAVRQLERQLEAALRLARADSTLTLLQRVEHRARRRHRHARPDEAAEVDCPQASARPRDALGQRDRAAVRPTGSVELARVDDAVRVAEPPAELGVAEVAAPRAGRGGRPRRPHLVEQREAAPAAGRSGGAGTATGGVPSPGSVRRRRRRRRSGSSAGTTSSARRPAASSSCSGSGITRPPISRSAARGSTDSARAREALLGAAGRP